ncbi:MAG: putative DNA binding domain-containing protein, partial [Lachnospiraceae bacterium]|nr:putative DNA binding domain-containing protein [Lachnospiraceae bacterium]
MMFEDEKVEFKEIFVPDIYKEVIAFANTDGGVILVGVNDNGEKVGLDDIDDTYTRITNGIRDAILPDVTMFIKYSLEKGEIIRIEIGEGAYKPYYLKSKGLKPSGVYVRQGASSAPASQDQIRQMIKYADGDVFEKLRSLNQELTFQYAAEVFKKNNLPFVEEKYYQLGIKSHEFGLFTNLGLLLSDQCLHTVKVAVFADDENTIFKDKKEFSGSILKQLEETFQYLQLCNQNHAVISGLERKDHW